MAVEPAKKVSPRYREAVSKTTVICLASRRTMTLQSSTTSIARAMEEAVEVMEVDGAIEGMSLTLPCSLESSTCRQRSNSWSNL